MVLLCKTTMTTIVRMSPPLIITEDQIFETLDKVEKSLKYIIYYNIK